MAASTADDDAATSDAVQAALLGMCGGAEYKVRIGGISLRAADPCPLGARHSRSTSTACDPPDGAQRMAIRGI